VSVYTKIGIINYGVGNIASLINIIDKVGGSADVITSPTDVPKYNCLILPGVGSFDRAMSMLKEGNWVDAIDTHVLIAKKPILGVCLGMQLFTRSSEEGIELGLGYIEAETISFDRDKMNGKLCIPHMGWNTVDVQKKNVFFDHDEDEQRFYFVHSYHLVCDNQDNVLTISNYGYDFVSSVQKENIIGVQFHPEKSHRFGYDFFRRFIHEVSS